MDQLKIGKFIAECRKQKQLTQLQLADKLGIHHLSLQLISIHRLINSLIYFIDFFSKKSVFY